MEKLTTNSYNEIMAKPVVFVDFWAGWCGPCMAIAPIYEELAEKYKDKALFLKCNVDEEQSLAINQGIMSIPCIYVYKNGVVVDKSIGLVNSSLLEGFIQRNI